MISKELLRSKKGGWEGWAVSSRSFDSLSCLERQINEAVRITSSKADFVLNSRSEFHQAPIVRLVATNGLQAEQGEEQGWVPVPARGGGAN